MGDAVAISQPISWIFHDVLDQQWRCGIVFPHHSHCGTHGATDTACERIGHFEKVPSRIEVREIECEMKSESTTNPSSSSSPYVVLPLTHSLIDYMCSLISKM